MILKNLAIFASGLAFSFLAYFIHSLFSVAPRMMVVKLPLYSFLGFAFFLSRYAELSRFKWFRWVNQRKETSSFSFGYPFAFFLLLMTLTGWGLYQFAPAQYTHHQLKASPLEASSIKPFEQKVNAKSTPYFLGELIDRQIRLRRVEPLAKTIEQLDHLFPRWQSHQYVKTLFYLEQGKEDEAINLALDFQQNSDKYFEPNIKLLMDLAARRGDHALFKKQFFYYLQLKLFEKKIYLGRIIFREVQEPLLIDGQEETNQLVLFYNDETLKSFFALASQSWADGERGLEHYRREVTAAINEAYYFRVEFKQNIPIEPQSFQRDMEHLFQLWLERDIIKGKKAYQQRETKRQEVIYGSPATSLLPRGMRMNLLRKKEEKIVAKTDIELHKKFDAFAKERLGFVLTPAKYMRKYTLKKEILDIFYRLPLLTRTPAR